MQEDILEAEESYSSDLLVEVWFELRDVAPEFADVPYSFIDCKRILSKEEIFEKLKDINIPNDKLERALDLLLWFGFIGIFVSEDDERYTYKYQHDTKVIASGLKKYSYCIHPGFRKTLGCI